MSPMGAGPDSQIAICFSRLSCTDVMYIFRKSDISFQILTFPVLVLVSYVFKGFLGQKTRNDIFRKVALLDGIIEFLNSASLCINNRFW
jgi:hypothetical protein